MGYEIEKTDAQWRAELDPAEFRVLRKGGTEAAFSGEYEEVETEGVYKCRACGNELFRSDTKFNAHCGWPAFYDPADSSAVELIEDRSHGMSRTEVRCARCGSHLGHVFRGEGFHTPTDERYCINSISLTLEPAQSESKPADPAGSAG
jgi:peptide-methionine (R)-S-oxide reductase